MILPRWYIEQASDYIEIVQSGVHSSKEVHDATVRQRKSEYELLKTRYNSQHSYSKPESSKGELETPWCNQVVDSKDLRRLGFLSNDQYKVDQSIFFRRRQ